ncbi:glycosyltransferase family 4 protein [Acidiphilium sp. PA]|uniref:glycosyltransferase family 4 protein n=1 Tax=Acidiphilium sp. PA TaxID=2871705 RepID=UPI0022432186|nr:glycosyltransferase family 4 protein [Acidiphilium sp. PA]MCW8305507.1 glycosyltransferase family 4 protein [Acidiphilium sp. PA]
MRILYSHRIQSRDGQSVHVEDLVAAFRAAGHEVLVVGPSFYESTGFGAETTWVARLRAALPGAIGELAELAYNIPAWWRLRGAAAAFNPDLIYERYNLFYLAGMWLARERKIPFLVEVNSPLAEERIAHGGLKLHGLARWTERAVWRAATRVFAVTKVLGARITAVGVDPSNLVITPNGINLDRFPPRPPTTGRRAVLGFIGFVRPWHGIEPVITALAESPDKFDFVIAGEGPARPILESMVASAGLAAHVSFAGLVAREAVPAFLAGIDIALQPRAVDYASPLKLFEYMAAGCAIVAPDQPNLREILVDGETALLFEPENWAALWACIARLAADPALRTRLGQAARAEVIGRDYTWAGNARRVIASLPS